jgi:uncharacterized membrane protein YidH (DUF202 family)
VSTATGPTLPVNSLLRTRIAWMRTSLATLITGFLLVRGGLTGSELPILAVLAGVISVVVIAGAMTRFTQLGRRIPPKLSARLPLLVSGGLVLLVVIAVVRLVLAAISAHSS